MVRRQLRKPRLGLARLQDSPRAGFWGALGFGAGGEAFDLRDGLGYSEDLYRPTVSLRSVARRASTCGSAAKCSVGSTTRAIAPNRITSVLFVSQFYPAPATGFYLKGGLGLGRNQVDFDDGFGVGDTGFAGLVGAGWEIRVGPRWYLNPAVDVVEQRYTGRGGEGYRERVVNFGVGVLFQAGR